MASKSRKVQDPDFEAGKRKRGSKAGKDPNAPKRPLSAFFCFSNEERPKVKAKFPEYTVGQIAKELGERWKTCANKTKFEGLAAKEKERYEEEMAEYKQNGSGGAAAKKPAAKAAPAAKAPASRGAAKSKPPPKKSKVEKDDDEDDEDDVDDIDEEEDDESD